jgi:hypothetical protein
MGTITHWVDERYTVELDEDDVELARLYLLDSVPLSQIVRDLHNSGLSMSKAVSTVNYARRLLGMDLRGRAADMQ